MTPKEKAEELIVKFMKIDTNYQYTYLQHKENAIVAINEVLIALEDICDAPYEYYVNVKKEIEKV